MTIQPTADELSTGSTGPVAPMAPTSESLGGYARSYVIRVRGGDMGSIPALTGLIVISIFFSIVHGGFLSAYNIEALVGQAVPVIIMAMGLIFVLLLGEIDLSAGTTGGVCAAVMAVLLERNNVPWYLAVAAALAIGLFVGFSTGWLRAKVGIPSFVITLATFLGFQGVTVILIGKNGSIILHSNIIVALEGLNDHFISPTLGWVLLAVVVVLYGAVKLHDASLRRRNDLPAVPVSVTLVKVAALAVVGGIFMYIMSINRILTQNAFFHAKSEGTPYSVLLILILFVIWNFVLTRTRYGRHIYAVGGNEEAARRAGIAVSRIRISVFVICSFMAALSGLAAASLLESVGSAAGAKNELLLAVGAAVIGGTSLFGGRGRMIDAVIGGLVVAVIQNGMSDLIQGGNSAGAEWIATGIVLLLAAGFDAITRRRSRVPA